MSTMAQNQELLKHLFELLQTHRSIFKQERSYQRVVALPADHARRHQSAGDED